MTVVRSADRRRTETPNAVMTTLASPTLGGAGAALWRVEMNPGAVGPVHAFDVEQIWTFLSGGAVIELDGEKLSVGPGDTAIVPAAAVRRIAADAEQGCTAVVTAPAGALVSRPDAPEAEPFVPGWIA